MHKFIFTLLATLMSTGAFAESKIYCSLIKGAQFKNSSIQPKEISFEAWSDDFSLTSATILNVNVTGTNEVYSRNALSITGNSSFFTKGGTQMDFTANHNSNEKAVVLIDRSPGEVGKNGRFKGLIVITSVAIDFTLDGAPIVSRDSLVYNIECDNSKTQTQQ